MFLTRRAIGLALTLSLIASACGSGAEQREGADTSPAAESVDSEAPSTTSAPSDTPIAIPNIGGAPLEGHTPQGFAGMGTGLFAGDNLNSRFPDGDGVQLFVAFPLDDVSSVRSAILRSTVLSSNGTPFEDLGELRAAPVVFETFSADVFDTAPVGDASRCERVGDRTLECDVSEALQAALDAGRSHLQLRVRFDTPGDNDGAQDLATFFLTDSNTNEPGIFTLDVQ